METLLLVPVDDSVVFPSMTVTLAVDVGSEDRVILVPRNGDEFASVGTVAEVSEVVRKEMESAFELSVPLKVDIGTGENWADAAPAGH